MVEAALDLDQWLKRVQKASSRPAVFKLLDEFRPLPWTDEQRASMGRAYIRRLESIKQPDIPDETSPSGQELPDGPVWYEKM